MVWMGNTVMEGEFGSEFSSCCCHHHERAVGLGLIVRACLVRCRFTRQACRVIQIGIYDENEFILIFALIMLSHSDMT